MHKLTCQGQKSNRRTAAASNSSTNSSQTEGCCRSRGPCCVVTTTTTTRRRAQTFLRDREHIQKTKTPYEESRSRSLLRSLARLLIIIILAPG